MKVQLEFKVKTTGDETVVGGLMGGKHWHCMARLIVDGEPATDWVDRMEYPQFRPGLAPNAPEIRTSWMTALAKASGWAVSRMRIDRTYKRELDNTDGLSPFWASEGGLSNHRDAGETYRTN